jgi:toxin ParE1/3/4
VKLRYTLPALADLNSVLEYIAAHSPQGARRVHARIQAIIDLLLLYPGIGTRTDDPTIRRMTALPYLYLILYEATETEIINHAVRHAARDPSGMPGASWTAGVYNSICRPTSRKRSAGRSNRSGARTALR